MQCSMVASSDWTVPCECLRETPNNNNSQIGKIELETYLHTVRSIFCVAEKDVGPLYLYQSTVILRYCEQKLLSWQGCPSSTQEV